MHRSLVAVALLALVPFAGGLAPRDAPLERHAVPAPCVPTDIVARDAGSYVALSWTGCASAEGYRVLRGPSAAELRPIVEVNHASHIDFGASGAVAVYAIQTLDGPLSARVAIALG